ncbi:hypothetical protein BN1723_018497, partial [Verticillium longisporum]
TDRLRPLPRHDIDGAAQGQARDPAHRFRGVAHARQAGDGIRPQPLGH